MVWWWGEFRGGRRELSTGEARPAAKGQERFRGDNDTERLSDSKQVFSGRVCLGRFVTSSCFLHIHVFLCLCSFIHITFNKGAS